MSDLPDHANALLAGADALDADRVSIYQLTWQNESTGVKKRHSAITLLLSAPSRTSRARGAGRT
jgi:hypothetical protein